MTTRKTFEVADLLEQANWFLKNSPDASVCERNSFITIVGRILYATGNYAGYTYLESAGKDRFNMYNDTSRIELQIKTPLMSRYAICEFDRVAGGGVR